MRPNPSVNATANGMAPGPRSTVAYHVLRGPGAMPSSARYLKRWGARAGLRGCRSLLNRRSPVCTELNFSDIEATREIATGGQWLPSGPLRCTSLVVLPSHSRCAPQLAIGKAAATSKALSVRLTSALRAGVLRRAVSLSGTALTRSAPIVVSPCRDRWKLPEFVPTRLVIRATKSSFASSCAAPKGVRPNPSVNATANGVAPGPRSTVAYHVLRGPGATPSSARYLKREAARCVTSSRKSPRSCLQGVLRIAAPILLAAQLPAAPTPSPLGQSTLASQLTSPLQPSVGHGTTQSWRPFNARLKRQRRLAVPELREARR
jgi:hypothetical protein